MGLPYIYNALKTLRWEGVHTQIWRDENVKNVHYILMPKPWTTRECEERDRVTHGWFFEISDERLKKEKEAGIEDGF